jgi:4-amino-4-deoxy-L-arabinose transferase-like glycosyltransferase
MFNMTDHTDTSRNQPFPILGFLALLLAARLLVLLLPVDLIPDEAYYWDWSRRPDWCYFSKPPMIAWLIGLSTTVCGTQTWAVRLPAALLNTGALALLFALGTRMYSRRTGILAMLLFLCSPAGILSGFFMTIDPPLVFCWAAALYCFWRGLEDTQSLQWWLLCGLATACGILSKQMMLVFLPLALITCIVCPAWRIQLKRPGFYLFLVLSLLTLISLLWWNYTHDWITFQHTSSHFNTKGFSILRVFGTFFYFIGTQMAVISPVSWLLFILAGGFLLWHFRDCDNHTRLLLVFSLVPLVVITTLSLRQRILPNWPAVFYLSGCILLPAWFGGHINCSRRLDALRRFLPAGLMIGFITGVLCIPVLFLASHVPWGTQNVRNAKFGQWSSLGRHIGTVYESLPDRSNIFFMAVYRGLVAECAFYIPGNPRVYEWPMDIVVKSQYGLWPGPETELGRDMLLITGKNVPLPISVPPRFRSVKLLGTYTTPNKVHSFTLYRANGLKRWPKLRTHLPETTDKTD